MQPVSAAPVTFPYDPDAVIRNLEPEEEEEDDENEEPLRYGKAGKSRGGRIHGDMIRGGRIHSPTRDDVQAGKSKGGKKGKGGSSKSDDNKHYTSGKGDKSKNQRNRGEKGDRGEKDAFEKFSRRMTGVLRWQKIDGVAIPEEKFADVGALLSVHVYNTTGMSGPGVTL